MLPNAIGRTALSSSCNILRLKKWFSGLVGVGDRQQCFCEKHLTSYDMLTDFCCRLIKLFEVGRSPTINISIITVEEILPVCMTSYVLEMKVAMSDEIA